MSNQPPESNPTVPGAVLAGKYRVERIIGQGGMGVVVEARHITLDDRVALKFLLPEYATHPEAAGRFLREARAAVKIKSEHIARVSDVGTLDTGAPYMVMEFLEGRDLSKLLETAGVLMVPDAIDYIIQGCEALAEAHAQGIVHRDIKPANLFLTKRSNGSPLVKLLDFGISKVTGNAVDNLTKTTAAMGSALYMSPEQMQTTRGVDHRTDIYAMGISLYELLAGKQPFYAETLPQLCAEIFTGTPTPIRTLRQDVPEELAQVMEKAYARDRAFRHQSVAELVIALAPFAPSRSWPTIEGVARMAGLDPPVQGARPSLPTAPAPGGTQVLAQQGQPSPSGQYAAPAQYAPPGQYAPLAPPGPSALLNTDPSTLRSSGAPAASGFPQTTGPGVSVVSAPVIPVHSSKGPILAFAAVALVGVLGAGAFFGLRARGSAAPQQGTAAAPPSGTARVDAAPPVESASAAPVAPPSSASGATAPAAPAAPTTTTSAAVAPTVAGGPLPQVRTPGALGKAPGVQGKAPVVKGKAAGKATDVGF